jgi:hypothetical protein
MRRCFLLVLAALLLSPLASASPKPVVLFAEGDSSVVPKFINMCRKMGPERGLDFRFVDKKDDPYDYRVVLSAEGSGVWNYAQGNIVVLNPDAKVIFTVTRSNRLTAKGATSALTKEFVKVMARYLGTHK